MTAREFPTHPFNPRLPFTMNKPIALALLVVGVVLLIFGLNAGDSIASTAKEAVTGTPTDRSIWLIVLGVIGIISGGLSLIARGRS